jgi:hypothetical protein
VVFVGVDETEEDAIARQFPDGLPAQPPGAEPGLLFVQFVAPPQREHP